MNILYIHQYFKTPSEPGGTRSFWVAKKLVESGHRVIMLTTKENQSQSVVRENIEGIEVIYMRNSYSNKMGVTRRLISFIRFMFLSSWIGLKQKNIHLVIATSTPLTIGVPALILKKLKRIPYIFEVRDLWPEVPIQMGGLNNKLLQNLAVWFERVIYKNAKHIITLSPGMFNGVVKHSVDKIKVSMIPNMAKTDKFWPRKSNDKLCNKLGISADKFNVIHFGAMGIANGLEYIIQAAKVAQDQNVNNLEFIFLGDGKVENSLKCMVNNLKLNNVTFLGSYPMSETSDIVNCCDVSLVTFADIPILRTNSPNKLFDSLSAGKPIIVNSCGWTKEMVEQNKCGLYADPSSPEELLKQIIYLKNNQDICSEMGINSRLLAERKYDKSILCDEFAQKVEICLRADGLVVER